LNEQSWTERLGPLFENALAPLVGQVFSAASIAYWSHDAGTFVTTFGGVTSERRYDLGELTEVFTLTTFLQQVQTGRLWLDTPVHVLLTDADERLTFLDLLTHTSGLPTTLDLTQYAEYEERLQAIEQAKPEADAIGAVRYSPLDFMQIGLALETLEGFPLDQMVVEAVLSPLGLLAGYGDAADENVRALDGVAGNGGLFATVDDALAITQMYIDEGRGAGFLSEIVTQEAITEHRTGQGLGWNVSARDGVSIFGLRSATGCVAFGSRETPFACVVLTDAGEGGTLDPVFDRIQAALLDLLRNS